LGKALVYPQAGCASATKKAKAEQPNKQAGGDGGQWPTLAPSRWLLGK
jgi:hypothetical protein